MHFTDYCALAAIVVELVSGLVVVTVRIDAAVTVACDVGPGRPRWSPAGGLSNPGRPARRRRRPRRSRSPSRVAGRMPALRAARLAGSPSRAAPGGRGGGAGGPRRPDRPGRQDAGTPRAGGGRPTDGPAGVIAFNAPEVIIRAQVVVVGLLGQSVGELAVIGPL